MKTEVIKTKLKHMFKESKFFDVTGFDALIKLANVIVPKDVYDMLHALHCVDYSSMSSKLRKELYQTVLECFNEEGFNLDAIDLILTPAEQAQQEKGLPLYKKILRIL